MVVKHFDEDGAAENGHGIWIVFPVDEKMLQSERFRP